MLVCAGIATHGDIERIRVVLRTFCPRGDIQQVPTEGYGF